MSFKVAFSEVSCVSIIPRFFGVPRNVSKIKSYFTRSKKTLQKMICVSKCVRVLMNVIVDENIKSPIFILGGSELGKTMNSRIVKRPV